MLRIPASNSGSEGKPQIKTGDLERVVVIGSSCAGKTTFARRLSDALEVPNIEADAMRWLPNWVPRPAGELRTLVEQAVGADRWVADGNYGPVVWRRATCLIWLNYPFRVVFWRALRRTTKRVFTEQRLYSGNRLSFRRAFLRKDSVLLRVITRFHSLRRRFPLIFAKPEFSHLCVIVLKSQSDADEFLLSVGA